MTVRVQIDSGAGQRGGDWVVRMPGKVISRHRKKSAALSKGRAAARKRNDVLKAQTTGGQWQTVVSHR